MDKKLSEVIEKIIPGLQLEHEEALEIIRVLRFDWFEARQMAVRFCEKWGIDVEEQKGVGAFREEDKG